MSRNVSRIAIVIVAAASGLLAQADPEKAREREAAIRSFNDSPSVGRFSDAGIAILEASGLLSQGPPNPALLPKNRAFEAMKARLAAGILVSPAAFTEQKPFSSPTERITLAMLPDIRPSFFRRDDPLFVIALRPFRLADDGAVGLIDGLSGVNQIVMRVRVAAPAGGDGLSGSWDVDSVEARFEREALIYGVTPEGRATGYRVRSVMTPIGWQPCSGSSGSVIGTRVNSAWSSSIIAWIGRPAPENSTVTSRLFGGASLYRKLVTETIDVDRDGVADFSTWAGIDRSEIVDDVDIAWKAVFVNRGGKWVLGDYRSEPDCT